MKRTAIIGLAILVFGQGAALFAQFPQAQRNRDRLETSEKASAERERAERDNPKLPAYPPARMNIDVQMVLTTLEQKDFAAAKPLAVARVADGDPLWLYVKFNGTLERYVYRHRSPDGSEQYMLFVEVGPQGDVTAKNHYLIHFEKEDLKLTELKISLAPGAPGHIKAIPVFLRNAAAMSPGRWSNELRLTNRAALPRSPEDHLAKVSLTYDFSKGLAKYPKMVPDFNSFVLRGSTDISKLPLPSKFDDLALRTEIQTKLEAEGIKSTTLYFAGDGWAEYSDQPLYVRQTRNIFAAFTYTVGKDCKYGIAEVVQTYDGMSDSYTGSVINLQKDLSTPCIAAP